MVSKTVRKRTDAQVHTWRYGEEVPEGFDVTVASDGKRTAVKRAGADIARNHEGHAVAVPEGGALIVHANGTHTTVGPKPTAEAFSDPDGNIQHRVIWGDNDEGIREALRQHGYDPADLDLEDPAEEGEDDERYS